MNLMASVSKLYMRTNNHGGDVLICHVSNVTHFYKCNGEIEC